MRFLPLVAVVLIPAVLQVPCYGQPEEAPLEKARQAVEGVAGTPLPEAPVSPQGKDVTLKSLVALDQALRLYVFTMPPPTKFGRARGIGVLSKCLEQKEKNVTNREVAVLMVTFDWLGLSKDEAAQKMMSTLASSSNDRFIKGVRQKMPDPYGSATDDKIRQDTKAIDLELNKERVEDFHLNGGAALKACGVDTAKSKFFQ